MFRPGNLGHLGRLGLVAASAYAQSVIASQAYDPHYANVSLLLHFDGPNGGTSFTDNSSVQNTVSAIGSTSISSANIKFGSGSSYFAGGTNGIEVGDTINLGFGSGDYTVEVWVYVASASSYQAIFDNRLSGKSGIALYIGDGGKAFTIANDSYVILSSSIYAPLNQWYHLAMVRKGGILTGYVDGVADGSVSDYRELAATAGAYIGRSTTGQWLSGYIDDLRITKGVARYTESFTPPAAAFPNYGQPV